MNKGNLVEEYTFGDTKIRVFDGGYIDKTQADIDIILKRVEDIVVNALLKQQKEMNVNY